MFLVDLLIYGALILAALLLTGLAQIPWMGPLFYTLLVVVVLLAVFLIPLFTGLIPGPGFMTRCSTVWRTPLTRPFRPADAARLYAAGRRAAAASARHSVLPHLRPTGPKSRPLLQQLQDQAGWVYIRLTPPKQRTTPGRVPTEPPRVVLCRFLSVYLLRRSRVAK